MGDYKPVTAYEWEIPAQDQAPGKGLDADLKPAGNWTQLEYYDDEGKPYLKEYEGRGLLTDKKVIITGGDSGIGRSVAILMAREGADISIVYLSEEEVDAQHTKKLIESAGRKANLMPMDLLEDGSAQKVVDGHMKAFGKLDILVNNSSMQEVCQDHSKIDMGAVAKTLRLNLYAMMELSKLALQHMKRGSVIINSCSVAGYMGNPELVDYSATKGGISAFTRSLAQQLAPKGIRVNSVAPGIIWTPLQPATKGNPPDALKNIGVSQAPIGRPGMPVEVAGAYVFLASPLGSYFTGETMHGTGGIEVQG